MSTTAAAPVANGHAGPNGTTGIKKSAAKSRGALKRLKAKQKAAQGGSGANGSSAASESEAESGMETDAESVASSSTPLPTPSSSLTSLTDLASLDPSNPAYAAFAGVFKHFTEEGQGGDIDGVGADGAPAKGQVYYSDDEDEDEEAVEQRKQRAMAESGLTRRERRKAAKLSVAELKQLVERPEVVEWFDTDARDPRLLVTVKSYRNTVPVPVHWNAKRDYLAGKRGLEKPPYLLPQWIAETGIGEQRDALKAKEADQTLRQKTRERVQPKMGKMDIDYQRLHDAFFRFQGKPSMTKFGEAYYEGKELETDLRTKKPGELSDELVEALSIPPLAPPPWLIAMQRFGPPPSYPNLRIKGLNAPIPAGAQWGFHPGGWGKPPMDDFNRPLYGDVFGVVQGAEIAHQNEINKELWGEIEQVDVESEDEDSDEDEDEDGEAAEGEGEDGEEMDAPARRGGRVPPGGTETPSGLATPSGMQSITSTVPGGLETPDFIDLRKQRDGTESEVPARDSGPRDLYTVIPERETASRGFMGSSTAYDVASASRGGGGGGGGAAVLGVDDGRKRKADVEISITETDDLSQAELKKKYEESRSAANRVHVPGADVDRSGFEDVVAGEMKKRQRKDDKKGKEKEKYKF